MKNSIHVIMYNIIIIQISLFMYYDTQVIRKIKLTKIDGIECSINKVSGICLFEQEWKTKHLYCDYTEIWSVLNNYYKSIVTLRTSQKFRFLIW